MRRAVPISILLAATVVSAAGVALSGGPGSTSAARLVVPEPSWEQPRVTDDGARPPRFTLTLTREMPTPGWRLAVDSIDVDPTAMRIRAQVSEHAPEGVVSQVLTPATLELPLGPLAPGRYVLELWTRRGASGEPVLSHAMVLVAS